MGDYMKCNRIGNYKNFKLNKLIRILKAFDEIFFSLGRSLINRLTETCCKRKVALAYPYLMYEAFAVTFTSFTKTDIYRASCGEKVRLLVAGPKMNNCLPSQEKTGCCFQ